MNTLLKVSVMIPVYKVEKYLSKSINTNGETNVASTLTLKGDT